MSSNRSKGIKKTPSAIGRSRKKANFRGASNARPSSNARPLTNASAEVLVSKTPETIRPQVQFVTITEKNQFQRIDNFLLAYLKGIPKSKVYSLIRKGELRINKKRCKPETKLALNDLVRIPPVYGVESKNSTANVSESLMRYLDSAVLYEDNVLLVVNKPSGLAVHGGSGVNVGLIEALRKKYPPTQFLELVHRIDKDTSGCLLVAKKRSALRFFHEQFRNNDVRKTYHLAVHGQWSSEKKRVDAPLKRTELKSGERFVVVHQDGKPSQTFFKIISVSNWFSLLEAKPISGRTHQIRVHADYSGHPIVGDEKYIHRNPIDEHGMAKSRLMLHAKSIALMLPSGEKGFFEAPYDAAFTQNIAKMNLSREKVANSQ